MCWSSCYSHTCFIILACIVLFDSNDDNKNNNTNDNSDNDKSNANTIRGEV